MHAHQRVGKRSHSSYVRVAAVLCRCQLLGWNRLILRYVKGAVKPAVAHVVNSVVKTCVVLGHVTPLVLRLALAEYPLALRLREEFRGRLRSLRPCRRSVEQCAPSCRPSYRRGRAWRTRRASSHHRFRGGVWSCSTHHGGG